MRDLKYSDTNSMAIIDSLTVTGIVLFYREPTTKEKIKYRSEQIQALHKREFEKMFELQIEWAEKLLTGFSADAFVYDDKPISSDPSNKNYRKDWIELLKSNASDILETFTVAVMGQTHQVLKIGGVSEDFFTKSSGKLKTPGRKKKKNTT